MLTVRIIENNRDFVVSRLNVRGFDAASIVDEIIETEDIDLVQIRHEPINPVLKRIRERMSFLGQNVLLNRNFITM
jgi:hypothetical protein